MDLANFLGRPENLTDKTKTIIFDGDPEEQARIMYNNNRDGQFRKKPILFKVPPPVILQPAVPTVANVTEAPLQQQQLQSEG